MAASINKISHIDQAILQTMDAFDAAKKERWKSIAKMVALVAGLVLLAGVGVALIAPTPYAIVLIPLFAVFIVHCILPTAKYLKRMIPIAKAAQHRMTEYQTTIHKLIELKQKALENPALALQLAEKRTISDILNISYT